MLPMWEVVPLVERVPAVVRVAKVVLSAKETSEVREKVRVRLRREVSGSSSWSQGWALKTASSMGVVRRSWKGEWVVRLKVVAKSVKPPLNRNSEVTAMSGTSPREMTARTTTDLPGSSMVMDSTVDEVVTASPTLSLEVERHSNLLERCTKRRISPRTSGSRSGATRGSQARTMDKSRGTSPESGMLSSRSGREECRQKARSRISCSLTTCSGPVKVERTVLPCRSVLGSQRRR